jgi:hypothetical protein
MHLPRFPTYALALLVSAGVAAPSAPAFDDVKGKKDKSDKHDDKDKGKGKGKYKGGHDDDRDDDEDDNGGIRFRGMDRNGDGVITRREWSGNDVSFRNHDWNGDGVLSGREVRPGAERPNDPRPDRDRFREFDRDGNGVITRDEWPGTRAEFDRLDRNNNGRLNRDEFSRR